ncbi:hypothetical protein [Hyalangium gracile]|uniref:hypothetical protein n=1 Tax=Hyalangium gracile TaxID=394092 RepID=UPI001CCE1B4D|nr:hypothetical protein [Hyalangium gracile]
MRRLMCVVALSIGMLTGCGGTAEMETPDSVGTVEQGLACRYPDMWCPSGTICVDGDLCRKPCPSSGVCASGSACRISEYGTRFCF